MSLEERQLTLDSGPSILETGLTAPKPIQGLFNRPGEDPSSRASAIAWRTTRSSRSWWMRREFRQTLAPRLWWRSQP